MQVSMVTNGQADPGALLRDARRAGLVSLGVSIDGLESTHDAIRAPGAFARATKTVRVVASGGVPAGIICTLNRRNMDEMEAVSALAIELGASMIRFQLGKPMGNQFGCEALSLRPTDLLRVVPAIDAIAAWRELDVRIGDSIGYYGPGEALLRRNGGQPCTWRGCQAGRKTIGIQSDGSVKGCLSLQPRAGEEDPFIEGNVRQERLADIWNHPGAFALTRAFGMARLSGHCATCSHARTCRGGARCVAYSYTCRFGCDPMCYEQVRRRAAAARKQTWLPAAAATAVMVMGANALACGGKATGTSPFPARDGGFDADNDASINP